MIIDLVSESAKVSGKSAAKAKQVLKQHEREKEQAKLEKHKVKQAVANTKVKELTDVVKALKTQHTELKSIADKALNTVDKQLDKLHDKQLNLKDKYKVKMAKLENRINTLMTRITEVKHKAGLVVKTSEKPKKKVDKSSVKHFTKKIQEHIKKTPKLKSSTKV